MILTNVESWDIADASSTVIFRGKLLIEGLILSPSRKLHMYLVLQQSLSRCAFFHCGNARIPISILWHILTTFVWMFKQTEVLRTKVGLWGEARRSQVDQEAMWERWNLPLILLGPTPGMEMPRFAGFRVSPGKHPGFDALAYSMWSFAFTHRFPLG